MGVKSTVHLTREEAENRYIKIKTAKYKQKLQKRLKNFSNIALEDTLEIINDKMSIDNEGFENYIIKDNKYE